MTIRAYATHEAKQPLTMFTYEEQPLGHFGVEVAITHCGICHSDMHLIDNEWGISVYPLVPGHEIVGTVTAVGTEVHHLQIGQRVGIGWQRSTCMTCQYCLSGQEHLCAKRTSICLGRGKYGGYADRVRTDSRFVFHIPTLLASAEAAPLLCAGATVYPPLRQWVRPGMSVGIIGIGGLGHLALQFANAFGCEVTAFSSSPTKAAEAKQFGAHHFISSTDRRALTSVKNTFDLILSTVTVNLDWATYLSLLRPKGQLCLVGIPDGHLQIPIMDLIDGQKRIMGSFIGGRALMNEMLTFAATHHIIPQIERMNMSQVNEALKRLRLNLARYRIVLENSI